MTGTGPRGTLQMTTTKVETMTEWQPLRPDDVYDAERIATLRSKGYWEDTALAQHLGEWADERPDDVAVVDDRGGSLTAAELRDAAWRLAGHLSSRGVQPGDRVLVQVANRVEAMVAVFGVLRLGAILIPAQPALRSHDLRSLLERTGAVAVVVHDEHRGFDHVAMFRELLADAPAVREVVVVGDDAGEYTTLADALLAAPYAGPLPDPDDPALVIFTSGTTSAPKGCLHTSNTYMFTVRGTGAAIGAGPGEVMFMPSPVMHTTGLVVGVMIPVIFRMPTVLQGVWEVEAALDLIARQRCTITLGATAFATMFLDAYDPDRHDLSAFRLFGLAGAPIPAETVAAVQRTFGCNVVTLYGSSEGLILAATRLDDSIERIASSDGHPVEGVELEITDPAGVAVPTGTEGEIRLTAPGRFICYWADDDRTREAIDDAGRMVTGDLARMDDEGYIRITGRVADVIIRGGMNISAVEVESLLLEHPAVRDVAIVSMPDDRLGEKCCAYVVARGEPPTVATLADFLDERGVAKFKFPERVEVVEELPRNPTGKVEKFKLRAAIRRTA